MNQQHQIPGDSKHPEKYHHALRAAPAPPPTPALDPGPVLWPHIPPALHPRSRPSYSSPGSILASMSSQTITGTPTPIRRSDPRGHTSPTDLALHFERLGLSGSRIQPATPTNTSFLGLETSFTTASTSSRGYMASPAPHNSFMSTAGFQTPDTSFNTTYSAIDKMDIHTDSCNAPSSVPRPSLNLVPMASDRIEPIRQPYPPPPNHTHEFRPMSSLLRGQQVTPSGCALEAGQAFSVSTPGIPVGPTCADHTELMRSLPQNLVKRLYPDFSPFYAGDRTNPRNRSAAVSDDLNAAVWITNLPPAVTVHELLGQIRGCGRVYATVINPPTIGHRFAAAKVVFFELSGAHALIAQSVSEAGFHVGGMRARVTHNRIRSEEVRDGGRNSRVLFIFGVPSFVNEAALTAYFRSKFTFQIDEVITHHRDECCGVVEYRFGSYRCQAEIARMALGREKKEEVFTVRFEPDPCAGPSEPPEGIERLQLKDEERREESPPPTSPQRFMGLFEN